MKKNNLPAYAFILAILLCSLYSQSQPTQAETSTTVSANPGATFVGETVNFTAFVTSLGEGVGQGSVIFSDAGNVLSTEILSSEGMAVFTTNTLLAGDHNIVATYTGTPNFAPSSGTRLFKVYATGAFVTATAGSPQSTDVNTAFGTTLQATVKDASDNLLVGVQVYFTAPASGPSGKFVNLTNTTTATTNASGVATATVFTANGTAGLYNVSAFVTGGASNGTFSLTNTQSPIITTTGTLNPFTACAGTASTEQTFTVSGAGLTAASIIDVVAPAGFEVSLTSGSGFGASVNASGASGTVSTTTIYVRLAALASGTPSGNIACSSTGAITKNVAVSGTVNPVPLKPLINPIENSGSTPNDGIICSNASVNLAVPYSTLHITSPVDVSFYASTANFGPSIGGVPINGNIVRIPEFNGGNAEACIDPLPAGSLAGKIALIQRGTCTYQEKVLRAEAAGAIGVVIINNVLGLPVGMGAAGPPFADPTIPVVMISFIDGQTIKTWLQAALTVNGHSHEVYNSYLWSTGATSSSITETPANTTNYTVTVANEYNCTASNNFLVTVNNCRVCTGTVAINSNITFDLNPVNPIYSGPAELAPFITLLKAGSDPSQWKVIFDMGDKKLLVKSGVTITTALVNGAAPGISIKGDCDLEVESGGHIVVHSTTKNAGDIVVNMKGHITINGEVRDQSAGTTGLPGAISLFSKCGDINVGSTGLVHDLGTGPGGNVITLQTCGTDCNFAGDITVSGLVKSFASAGSGNLALNRPNVKVISQNGAVTINAYTAEPLYDEFQESGTLYDVYGGLLSWVRDNANPGKVEVQAKHDITVNGHGTDPTGSVRESFGAIAAKTTSSNKGGGLVDIRSIEGNIIATNRAFDVGGKNKLAGGNFARINLYAKNDINLSRPGGTNNFNPVVDGASAYVGGKGGVNDLRSYLGGINITDNALVSAACVAGSGSVQGTNLLESCAGININGGGSVLPSDLIPGNNINSCNTDTPLPLYTSCEAQARSVNDITEAGMIVSQENLIHAFPNPGNGIVTLQFSSQESVHYIIKVVDVHGKMVFTEKIFAQEGINNHKINLGGKGTGMYMLMLDEEEKYGDKSGRRVTKILVL